MLTNRRTQTSMSSDKVTVEMINEERNVERRRRLIERYGVERYVQQAGAQMLTREWFMGRQYALYRLDQTVDEAIVMLRVTNATPEPDGKFKNYWLRVPPTMTDPVEALAWTFGMNRKDYARIMFES